MTRLFSRVLPLAVAGALALPLAALAQSTDLGSGPTPPTAPPPPTTDLPPLTVPEPASLLLVALAAAAGAGARARARSRHQRLQRRSHDSTAQG